MTAPACTFSVPGAFRSSRAPVTAGKGGRNSFPAFSFRSGGSPTKPPGTGRAGFRPPKQARPLTPFTVYPFHEIRPAVVCDVLAAVRAATGYTTADLTGTSRCLDVTMARQLYCWLVMRWTGLTFQRAAEAIGKHHSSVLHNARIVAGWAERARIPALATLDEEARAVWRARPFGYRTLELDPAQLWRRYRGGSSMTDLSRHSGNSHDRVKRIIRRLEAEHA